MAVVIRLRRTGRKNRPCYRINVADTRFPRDGRMIETIGVYDPLRKDPAAQIVVDAERAAHWISKGAQVSEAVASFFRKKGLKLLPAPKKRDRTGRGAKKTATRAHRDERKATMAKAKEARRVERLKARRAAKKAAAAAETKS
jgi:small subunit ribosomal protein S16